MPTPTHVDMQLPTFAVIDCVCYMPKCRLETYNKQRIISLTRILFRDTLLSYVESFACSITPPLLQLALLVVKSAIGVKCMLGTG
jgi:hypothetical protein